MNNNNNLNIDENMMGKLQDIMKNGDLNNVISQIPPDMLQNFSSMMSNNSSDTTNEKNVNPNGNKNIDQQNINNILNNFMNNNNNSHNTNGNSSNNNGFDFNNIDMNTILKMKSMMDKMNSPNDGTNLLKSLKPYLRNEKKDKVDQYANLLNMSKLTEFFGNQNKQNKGD